MATPEPDPSSGAAVGAQVGAKTDSTAVTGSSSLGEAGGTGPQPAPGVQQRDTVSDAAASAGQAEVDELNPVLTAPQPQPVDDQEELARARALLAQRDEEIARLKALEQERADKKANQTAAVYAETVEREIERLDEEIIEQPLKAKGAEESADGPGGREIFADDDDNAAERIKPKPQHTLTALFEEDDEPEDEQTASASPAVELSDDEQAKLTAQIAATQAQALQSVAAARATAQPTTVHDLTTQPAPSMVAKKSPATAQLVTPQPGQTLMERMSEYLGNRVKDYVGNNAGQRTWTDNLVTMKDGQFTPVRGVEDTFKDNGLTIHSLDVDPKTGRTNITLQDGQGNPGTQLSISRTGAVTMDIAAMQKRGNEGLQDMKSVMNTLKDLGLKSMSMQGLKADEKQFVAAANQMAAIDKPASLVDKAVSAVQRAFTDSKQSSAPATSGPGALHLNQGVSLNKEMQAKVDQYKSSQSPAHQQAGQQQAPQATQSSARPAAHP